MVEVLIVAHIYGRIKPVGGSSRIEGELRMLPNSVYYDYYSAWRS